MVQKSLLAKLIPNTIVYIVCSVAGLMLIKTAGREGLTLLGLHLNGRTIVGLLIYVVGFCFYFFLLQNNNVSIVFPLVVGLNYVAVILSAALLLRESITPMQWAGIVAVLLGIVLMNGKPAGGG